MQQIKPVKESISSGVVILKAMIAVNVIMFIASLVFSRGNFSYSFNPLFFLTPSSNALEFLGATGTQIFSFQKFETWWSLIRANWLHGSLLHLVFNMMALYTLVPLTTREFGPFRMFSIYTLSGAAGFFISYIGQVGFTIGASSGLCGLIGACFYFGKSRGGPWGTLVFRQTTGWVISLLVIGFIIPNINNWGHGGGLIAGIFFGWLFSYDDKRKENIVDRLIGVLLAGVTLWLLTHSVVRGVLTIFS